MPHLPHLLHLPRWLLPNLPPVLTMNPPVSVCHQVSAIGHLASPTTSWYHVQATGLMGSPTLPSTRREDRSYFDTYCREGEGARHFGGLIRVFFFYIFFVFSFFCFFIFYVVGIILGFGGIMTIKFRTWFWCKLLLDGVQTRVTESPTAIS